MTRVSVLVTTYNGARFIWDQLASILDQTRTVDEVLIVDDGSTDDTCMLVRDFLLQYRLTNWRLSENVVNLGPSDNVLTHMGALEGDVILFADQDDVWEVNKVATILRVFHDHPESLLVASKAS